MDEEEEELDAEGEGSGSDDEVGNAAQGDLARGMEGERVLKSGYLWKKQERRKVRRNRIRTRIQYCRIIWTNTLRPGRRSGSYSEQANWRTTRMIA